MRNKETLKLLLESHSTNIDKERSFLTECLKNNSSVKYDSLDVESLILTTEDIKILLL